MDTAGALADEVVGTIATLETTAQPVLANVSDSVGTITSDVVDSIAPVETAAPTLLAAGTDAALPVVADVLALEAPVTADAADPAHLNQLISDTQSSVPDSLSTISAESESTAFNELDPIVAAGSSGNQVNDPLHAADPNAMAGAIVDGIDAALAPAADNETDPSSPAVADTSNVPAAHIGSSVLVSGAVTPLLAELDDASQATAPEGTNGLTNHAVASEAVVDTVDPLLASMSGVASQPTTASQTAA
jgi:hypothetical protein